MATPDQESIETFMSITGSSELVAIQKLTEHGANLNQAVNAHFTERDANIHETDVAASQEDLMDIDEPSEVTTHRPSFSPFSPARDMNPLSLLDSNFNRHIIDSGQGAGPFVSHPREVRQVPIEVKDENGSDSHHPDSAPRIEDVNETLPEIVPEARGTLSIDDEVNDHLPSLQSSHPAGLSEPSEGVLVGTSQGTHLSPSAPGLDDLPDYGIEEQMIQAAIEASKHDTEISRPDAAVPQQTQSQSEDPELAHVVSLSLKTAEQERASRELESEAGPSGTASKLAEVEEVAALASSNGRLGVGGSSIQDETDDADKHPLVRHRSRHMPSSSTDTAKNMGEVDLILSADPLQQENVNHLVNDNDDFPSDEWGGISSVEHDEAVMLEAALFGGIPETAGYHVRRGYMENGLDRTSGAYPRQTPRPPSPSLTAQRLIREQQDDEYLASLQADREKELQEQAAREAAMEEVRRKEEEAQRKLEEEQEIERQLAAKEASLPQEPTSDDVNAVTLLVRMPDGSRRGRRFLKTDKLQYLFDFIDIGRVVKPTAYRLVRPYPRRAFGDGESELTFNELGLTSKQEALFLESI
ncbi:plant UBX domain-containing protein 8 isoform X2 [Cynara cardunculus var. scolymus]|uniref:plant UBX domain-containing protein 8 isoform X2 n=1 Tax=Cynara cardunculus var. scolymus TaxID=59895 RepID=UPI000D624D94|nr:plant UBX domain-containing protein 8 isoform X2 [Cynara cardunculus var. scolymus]